MAKILFFIDTIDHSFGRTKQIQDYFQLQYELLEDGHEIQYCFSRDNIATTIRDKKHFYNFIRTFKFLKTEEIINNLHSNKKP